MVEAGEARTGSLINIMEAGTLGLRCFIRNSKSRENLSWGGEGCRFW